MARLELKPMPAVSSKYSRMLAVSLILLLPIPGLKPDVQGIYVGVRSMTSIPEEVSLIAQILSAGGIQYRVNPVTPEFFPDEPFVLIIGAKPT